MNNDPIARINELQEQVNQLSRKCEVALNECNTIIKHLPFAAFTVDAEMNIKMVNAVATDLFTSKVGDMMAIPDILTRYINIARLDGQVIGKIMEFLGQRFSVSIYVLTSEQSYLVIIRNVYSSDVAKEEVEARIREAIDLRMSLVQKIGFLLGEEAAEISKKLNSVMELLESKKEKI